MKSRKTTASGIVAALGMILTALAAALDGDPSTVIDPVGAVQALGVLMAALGMAAGGIFARDDNVSDEGQLAPKARGEAAPPEAGPVPNRPAGGPQLFGRDGKA